MKKTSFVIFKQDCMGCHACEIACKQEHGLGVGPRLIRVIERSPLFIPVYCHHCTKAPCLASCPVDAIYKDARNIVLINGEICIGCKECVEACPFGAMQFDDDTEIAIKCDQCVERIDKDDGPACRNVCPTQCIFWGDTKQLSERVTKER